MFLLLDLKSTQTAKLGVNLAVTTTKFSINLVVTTEKIIFA
jgi:hypothetical protein